MAAHFRVEHVAKVPRGWKVRTVTQGDHEVRIAFPAGRREKGSGHVVEILHPRHENPSYCPGSSRMRNPAELVLMGANPAKKRTTWETEARTKIARTMRRMPKPIRRVFANPETKFAIQWHTGTISNAFDTKAEAESMLEKFHGAGEVIRVNPMPLRAHRNPAATETAEASAAQDVREGFTESPITSYSVTDTESEPHVPAGDYALIGPLVLLAVKPTQSGKSYPNALELDVKGRGVLAIASHDRRQIYFVDGDQKLSSEDLEQFNSQAGGEVLLGECRQIVYLAKKYHPEVGNWARGKVVPYVHQFGEESGIKPQLFYDTLNERLVLRGGNYRVEDAGIVD